MEEEIHCPKCGSTQLSANKRGWNLTTGFIGSSKIKITCLNCGHQFKPGEGVDYDVNELKNNDEALKNAIIDTKAKKGAFAAMNVATNARGLRNGNAFYNAVCPPTAKEERNKKINKKLLIILGIIIIILIIIASLPGDTDKGKAQPEKPDSTSATSSQNN